MSNQSGMYQYDTPDTLVAASETAILLGIAMNGGTELSMNNGAGMEHILESFQTLKTLAINQVGLATPTYYFYQSTVQPDSQFIIAGPAGMDVTNQTQPQHVRLELLLNSAGQIVQAGACFVTCHLFHEAAPLNPPNQL